MGNSQGDRSRAAGRRPRAVPWSGWTGVASERASQSGRLQAGSDFERAPSTSTKSRFVRWTCPRSSATKARARVAGTASRQAHPIALPGLTAAGPSHCEYTADTIEPPVNRDVRSLRPRANGLRLEHKWRMVGPSTRRAGASLARASARQRGLPMGVRAPIHRPAGLHRRTRGRPKRRRSLVAFSFGRAESGPRLQADRSRNGKTARAPDPARGPPDLQATAPGCR